MARRAAVSFRARSVVTGLIALLAWAAFMFVPALAETRPDAMLFGLPLRTALALPVALPIFVLTMFWVAGRQNRDDERFRDDD